MLFAHLTPGPLMGVGNCKVRGRIRFKAKASKAKQTQSRVKALERMEKIAPVPSTKSVRGVGFAELRRAVGDVPPSCVSFPFFSAW